MQRQATVHGAAHLGRRSVTITAGFVALALIAASCSDDDDDDDEVATTEAIAPAGDTDAPAETEAPETTEAEDPVAAAQARVDDAEDGVTDAQAAFDEAGDQFCTDAGGYVEALDRYGRLFTDEEVTVGDVTTGGADLIEPRDTVSSSADAVLAAKDELLAAQQELIDAQAALAQAIVTASSLPASTNPPETTTTTTIVPEATIDRIEQAERDLERTAEGITDETPLSQATAEYNSAAFALQIAWLRLLSDAGCLDDEQQAEAVAQVTAFTANLQSELQLAGYYEGAIDGIYGPETVAAVKSLQADSGLPETGFMDIATTRALNAILEELNLQQTRVDLTHTAIVQTVLMLTGHWTGPVDGVWTDELTQALMDAQTDLGVPATGVVDPPTMAAFEQFIAELRTQAGATTTVPTPTTEPPETAAPAPETEPPTESSTAPSTSEA